MKISYNFLIFITACLILSSCSDDDDTNISVLSNSDIEGNWAITEINSTPAVDLESNGNTDPNLLNQTNCFDGMALDFDSNGNLNVTSTEITFDENASPSFVCSLRNDLGSYLISGGNLTVTIPISGNQETQTISVNIQNNTMSFSLTQSDVAQFFNIPSGENFSSINELEFVYQKN